MIKSGVCTSVGFASVLWRQGIAQPDVQNLLTNLPEGESPQCGCGHVLIRFRDARSADLLNLRRKSVMERHNVGCFAEREGSLRLPLLYGEGAFDQPREARTTPGSVTAERAADRRYGSFTHLVHQWFAAASIRAFRSANLGLASTSAHLKNFSSVELHAALADVITDARTSTGRSVRDCLAARGLEVLWGVTTEPISEKIREAGRASRAILLTLPDVKTTGPAPRDSLCQIEISAHVAKHAGVGQCAHGTLIEAPYFFFAAVRREAEEDGVPVFEANRVVAFPVASVEALYHVDSQFERSVILLRLLNKGIALLKPGVHYCMPHLGREFWPYSWDERGHLPHRPDAIVYYNGRVWLAEFAGMEGKPGYLDVVNSRLAAMVQTANRESGQPEIGKRILLSSEFEKWLRTMD